MKKLLLILLCLPMIGFGQRKEEETNNNNIEMEKCISGFLNGKMSKQGKDRDEAKYAKAYSRKYYSCLCEKLLVRYESFDKILEVGKDGVPDEAKPMIFDCIHHLPPGERINIK